MPKNFKTTSEVREELLAQTQKWRESFERLKTIKDVTSTMGSIVDEMASVQNFTLLKLDAQDKAINQLDLRVDNVGEGLQATTKILDTVTTTATTAMAEGKHAKQVAEGLAKKTLNSERHIKHALTAVHQIQLDRAQSVIIIRGIPPVTGKGEKETYMHMTEAFHRSLRKINCSPVKCHNIKRLPVAKGAKPNAPRTMEVDLGSIGAKLEFFTALDQAV